MYDKTYIRGGKMGHRKLFSVALLIFNDASLRNYPSFIFDFEFFFYSLQCNILIDFTVKKSWSHGDERQSVTKEIKSGYFRDV